MINRQSQIVNRQSQAGDFRAALLRWYKAHARPLPWRKTTDPYAIWVSEVMLQQTQVETVIPYYKRFLRAFPNCRSLAGAPFHKVAELWAGLGYYRRARNLHLGARKIVKEFGGRFPPDYEQALKIPGVGHYTASAVLSIGYNKPLPVLDGNVARVTARLEAIDDDPNGAKFRRTVETRLTELISTRNPAAFNQALMELGQTRCLPRVPACAACPVRRWCRAFLAGIPESYPAPRRRRAAEPWQLAVAIIEQGSKVALIRGLEGDLLTDLWNFPAAFGQSQQEALDRLRTNLEHTLNVPIRWSAAVGVVRHQITFRSIHATLYRAELPAGTRPASFRWFSVGHLQRAPVSALARKIVTAIADLGKNR